MKIKLAEPATFWTDCALALWSGVLAVAITLHVSTALTPLATWWVGAFATCAVAALAGAIHHGFGEQLPADFNLLSWRIALLSLVGTGLCLMQAAAHLAFDDPGLGLGGPGLLFISQRIAWLIAVAFAIAALRIGKFSVAIAAYGLGQLAVFFAVIIAREHRSPAHLAWMLTAITVSGLAALIQHLRLSPSPRFNHNDLYHVVQFAAQGCFYLGVIAAL